MRNFVGLDWGGAGHAVCVVDDEGRIIARMEARHDAAGLADLLMRLGRIAPAGELPVAIERPSGLLVDTLAAAGHPIVPIHPNVVKASRPRYRTAGKSDPADAYMLADILRTDGHRFRPIAPLSDEIKALRALVRGRDDLVAQRVAMANQLRALLQSFWPGAAAVFADIDSAIALAFIRRYPTPHSARRLGEARMAAFLAQNTYCNRRSPAELLDRLRAAPAGQTGQAETEANGQLACALAELLRSLIAQIASITSRIEHAIAQLPDGRMSCPSPAPDASAPPKSSPNSAMSANASRHTTTSPPRPASHRSHDSPENTKASSSDGPATKDCETPSQASPTTRATPLNGQARSIKTPVLAAADTLTQSVSSQEHGSASSGQPGHKTRHTIRQSTTPLNKSHARAGHRTSNPTYASRILPTHDLGGVGR